MPPWAHTVDNQHLAFAVISRSMCLVNDQCEASCAYPLRAFLLLVDPTMADAIMAEKCQWDAWTAMFVGSHAARGGIASRDALEHLRATALVLQLDTAQLEASHAAVRRAACMLSTQTHGESFLDASAESVLRKARAHGDLLAQALGATVDGGVATSAPASGDRKQIVANRRGGGGAWRAFVALHYGCESADLGHLAVLYRNLDDEEREHLVLLGAEAARAHREGGVDVFGAGAKSRKRKASKRLLQAACEALSRDPEATLDDHELMQFLGGGAVARAGGDGSSWGRVAAVKALCAVERKVLLATRGKADEDFRETPEKLQAVVLEKLAEAMPTLGSRTADVEVLPHCESAGGVMYNRISWRPVRACIHACEVAALPAASKSGALVLGRLRQLWCKLHTKVISDDIAGIGAEPPCKHSACFAANMCVCKASGRTHLQTMKANLQKAFTIVMRDSAISAVVMMARCVVLLVGRTPEQLEDGAADLPAGAHGVGDGLNKMYETALWMHVGHLSKSPWRPAFLGLAGEEGVPLDALRGGHRDLLASSQPRSLYRPLDLLDVDLRWDVAFFRAGPFCSADRGVRAWPCAGRCGWARKPSSHLLDLGPCRRGQEEQAESSDVELRLCRTGLGFGRRGGGGAR